MSVYKVTGRLGYKGHQPGEYFEAVLDPLVERRAIARRNIILIDKSTPKLQPGSFKLPKDWVTNSTREVQDDE